jgi:translocation and assembly module TamB
MPARLLRLLRAVGWTLLGLSAALGVALAVAGLLASTGPGSRPVGAWVAGILDGLVEGHFRLGRLFVTPGGDVELRDLVITDPEGHTVLSADRALLRLDLGGLGRRSLGVELTLERPEVWLEPGHRGRLTIVDAFTALPATAQPRVAGQADPWHGWAIRVTRLQLRQAAVHWRGEGERRWLEAVDLDVKGAGRLGSPGIYAAIELGGRVEIPLEGPLTIALSARIEGSRLTVPSLVLGAASSRLELFGEWDWSSQVFRAAASRLALAERDLTALVGRRVAGGDLEGRLYAESDGTRLSAHLDLAAPGGGGGGGRVALSFLPEGASPRTFGFDVALSGLDPSRLLSRAPRGSITAAARGAITWPLPAPGPFSRGQVTVDRLDARLPGLVLAGAGRWRDAGAMSGTLRVEASDLTAAGAAAEALLGLSLPALAGQAEANLALKGTVAAPELALSFSAPQATVGGLVITAGKVEARLAGRELEVEAVAALGPRDGVPVSLRGAASLAPGWSSARVGRLELGLGGPGWVLASPATVAFEGPSVDRLELRSGAQRLILTGGLEPGGDAEARLEVKALDLARLPPWLVPASLGLSGTAGATARLAGSGRRRTLDATFEVTGGAFAALTGLELRGEAGWRADHDRSRVAASLRRAEGGTVSLEAELPWPPRGAASNQPLRGRVALGGWTLAPLLAALEVDLVAEGRLEGELTLDGTVGAPRLTGRAALAEGRWAGLAPIELTLAIDAASGRLGGVAELKLDGALQLRVDAELPLDQRALLDRPGPTLAGIPRRSWSARLLLPGTELATLAGKAGVPAGLLGRLSGEATLQGTPAAPRGQATLTLTGVGQGSLPAASGPVIFRFEEARTAVEARLTSDGLPALRLDGSVAAPVEQLGVRAVQQRAALVLSGAVPGLTLPDRPGERWLLAGEVTAALEASGTLAGPVVRLQLEGRGLKLGGKPFGELVATAKSVGGETQVDVALRPVDGGELRLDGAVGLVPGLQTGREALAGAPLRLRASGRDLSIAFLPLLFPGQVRSTGGTVQAALAITGTARAPRLAGTSSLDRGRVTLPGYGTFSDIGFAASFDQDDIRLDRIRVVRGAGHVEGSMSLEGLSGAEARLGGALTVTGFTVARGGTDLVTLDASLALGGRYRTGRLEAEVTLAPGATVRLPRKAPRNLQPITDRVDILVGEARPAPAGAGSAGDGNGPGPASSFEVSLRVRGEEFLLKSDQPRVLVALQVDATFDLTAKPLLVLGRLETLRGTFEPLAGRLFKVVRGHVGFAGGPLGEAQLDLSADYENPTAKVHAIVSGTLDAPTLRLTSEPAMDEASLAMLIVTGRAEMTAGGASGTPFTAQDAGMAAALAVANKLFEDRLGEKMPLDSLTLDSTAVTAGKQLTDRFLVTYVRRFDSRPEKGENSDEVRVQYHLSRRWTLESRYGNAGAGSASLMWQKDY